MKPLFSSVLETIVLFAAIGLVFLGAKLFGYESPYNDFKDKYPDTVITVSSAIGAVPDGTILTPEEAAEKVGHFIFGKKSDKKIPMPIAKLLCIEIGEFTAKVIRLYPFIVFFMGLFCLAFGIGLPSSLYRHVDPARRLDDLIVNKNFGYYNEKDQFMGYLGQDRADTAKFIVGLIVFIFVYIWSIFLPLFIVLNFAVGVVMSLLRLLGISVSDSAAKSERKRAAGKSGKDTYRIIADSGLFMVAGDKHPNRTLYFRQYWNAVIAKRIMERDVDIQPFTSSDAQEVIQYGDENEHERYETSRRINKSRLLTSSSAKAAAASLENDVKSMNYTFSRVRRGSHICEYIIMFKNSDKYMLFRIPLNISLITAVMHQDAAGEDFGVREWNIWARKNDNEKLELISCYSDWVDPPAGEEVREGDTQQL
ncbi:MAG: hypothetical protein ACI4KG_06940 [Oscillospiraceae bacterium]